MSCFGRLTYIRALLDSSGLKREHQIGAVSSRRCRLKCEEPLACSVDAIRFYLTVVFRHCVSKFRCQLVRLEELVLDHSSFNGTIPTQMYEEATGDWLHGKDYFSHPNVACGRTAEE
jgi:hypothetical protein